MKELKPSLSCSYDQSYTKIMTSIMGGTPIDVIICDSVWTAEFTEASMITSVDDYISAELKEDLFPGFVDQCSCEGKPDGAAYVRSDQMAVLQQGHAGAGRLQ